ncbi:hypothetical protein EYR40_003718 [Pleurotus pulmonarius]|nr:hypothetical protein EYR40_003718 [Pleurotus pulmonarius]KAF4606430.1 hypothetical protein EYR38_000484 [Pleurotus pulmonarius]
MNPSPPMPQPPSMRAMIATYMSKSLANMPAPAPMTPTRAQMIRKSCEQAYRDTERLLELRATCPRDKRQEINNHLMRVRLARSLIYWQLFRINDLPNEILSIILRDVVWSGTVPEAGVTNRLRITWVSKRWREVAINDSTLWSAIWFRDPAPQERSFCWFERAGKATLDIRVAEPRGGQWTGEEMAVFLDRLFVKLEQIRSLIVVVDNWPPALVVLDKIQEYSTRRTFGLLERFEIHRNGSPYVWIGAGYEPDRHRDPMKLFGGAILPALRSITINGVHIDWNRSPLSNLTRLDIRRIPLEMSPTLPRFREILQNCPDLARLSLDGAGPVWTPPLAAVFSPIVLPNLRHLVIGDYSLQYAMYVGTQISAPNIRALTLMNLVGEDYAPFFNMITGAFPDIRVLTVHNIECVAVPASRAVMVKWLKSMPKVGYLRMANLKMNFLQLFLGDGEDPSFDLSARWEGNAIMPPRQIITPNLLYLEVYASDPALVASLVLARKAIGAPFRKVFVDLALTAKFTPEQSRAFVNGSQIYVLPVPVQTPEEAELMAD